MKNRTCPLLIRLGLLLPLLAQAGGITKGTDEQAKLPYWQYRDDGMSLRLVQRLPDQSRAFFLARGFSSGHAELIAQSCIFQTVFKNISNTGKPSPLTYNLRNWVISYKGKLGAMKTREDWDTQWQQLKAPQPARIAFEWSLVPTVQTYQAGDYNWGMSSFNLKPGSKFDLKLTWRQHGRQRSAVIPGIQCAADISSQPEPQ